MDVAGEQQLDVEHNLFKRRLDKDLKAVTTEAEIHGNLQPLDIPTPGKASVVMYIFPVLIGYKT